jgi:hypothetical protein
MCNHSATGSSIEKQSRRSILALLCTASAGALRLFCCGPERMNSRSTLLWQAPAAETEPSLISDSDSYSYSFTVHDPANEWPDIAPSVCMTTYQYDQYDSYGNLVRTYGPHSVKS